MRGVLQRTLQRLGGGAGEQDAADRLQQLGAQAQNAGDRVQRHADGSARYLQDGEEAEATAGGARGAGCPARRARLQGGPLAGLVLVLVQPRLVCSRRKRLGKWTALIRQPCRVQRPGCKADTREESPTG